MSLLPIKVIGASIGPEALLPGQKTVGGYAPPEAGGMIQMIRSGGLPYMALFLRNDQGAGINGGGIGVEPEHSFLNIPIVRNMNSGADISVMRISMPAWRSRDAECIPNNVVNNATYRPFHIGKFEDEAKKEYVKIIKALFGSDVPGNSEGNITPEVIALVSQALNEVQKGSKGMLAADLGYNLFYSATAWSDFIVTISFNAAIEPKTKTVSGWVSVLNETGSYQSVRDAVTLKYKSAVAAELIR